MTRHARGVSRSHSAVFASAGVLVMLCGFALEARPASAQGRHFLWRVERGSSIGFLMGSIHVLTPEYYPLSPRIEEAFARSGTLLEEIDLGEMSLPETQLLMATKAMYSDGRTLDSAVSKETYAMIEARLKTSGLPIEVFMRMKPWVVAAVLLTTELQRAGFDPELGLDRHFYDKAIGAGKRVEGLETVAFQVDRFDQMADALQEALLRETVRDIDVQKKNVKALADAWVNGDVSTLERMLLAGLTSSPAVYERLLLERNRAWIPKIEACLARPTPCFVVVGAGHLVGKEGLIDLLSKQGYRLTQQ